MEMDYKRIIARSQAPFFTRQNLEVLLGKNRRTLDYRIRALIAAELLLPLKAGFYLNQAYYERSDQSEELLRYIATQLVEPSYISLEYALSFYGILTESVYELTLITSKKTRLLSNSLMSFRYRNLKEELFFAFESRVIGDFTYNIATPAKALFDYIYLTPLPTMIERMAFLYDSRLNWEQVDMTDLRSLVKRSKSVKMQQILELL